MPEIQIRDVALEIRQRAIVRAKLEGTTLQAVLRAFLKTYAEGATLLTVAPITIEGDELPPPPAGAVELFD